MYTEEVVVRYRDSSDHVFPLVRYTIVLAPPVLTPSFLPMPEDEDAIDILEVLARMVQDNRLSFGLESPYAVVLQGIEAFMRFEMMQD